MHLVGFTIEIYNDTLPYERQMFRLISTHLGAFFST